MPEQSGQLWTSLLVWRLAVERIALDLLLLARLEVAAGNLQAGHNYAQRAAAIAEAAKLNDLSAQTRTLLDKAASQ